MYPSNYVGPAFGTIDGHKITTQKKKKKRFVSHAFSDLLCNCGCCLQINQHNALDWSFDFLYEHASEVGFAEVAKMLSCLLSNMGQAPLL